MNFRSLLIILYLNLNQNSEALSEGVTGLIRGTRCVLEYAPRTPKCRHSQQVASDDARSDVFRTSTPRVLAYAPRTPRLQPPINRMRGQPVLLFIFSLLSPVLHRFACQKYPKAPVLFSSPEASPEIPKIPRSAVPEPKLCPREVRFL